MGVEQLFELEDSFKRRVVELSPEFYVKAHSFMKNSKPFKDFTLEGSIKFIDEANEWDAPQELVEAFPYYFLGYDAQDRPIWMAELGKYDIKGLVLKGKEAMADMEKYLFKSALLVLKSMLLKDTPKKQVREGIFVEDWAGLDMSQVLHFQTIQFSLNICRTYLDLPMQVTGLGICINVNYIGRIGYMLGRPVLGPLLNKVQIYGTDQKEWKAALRRHLPRECIPVKYGGDLVIDIRP